VFCWFKLGAAVGFVNLRRLSDPFGIFSVTSTDGTDTATFSGTATPDPVNAGRYTMRLGIAVAADPVNFTTAIYQASGGQLIWLDENANGQNVFFGSLQQQGSLTGLPAAQRPSLKARSKPARSRPSR
jgi:hypothetical protein